MKDSQINNLALAYLGDAIYELEIRNYFIKQGIYKVNKLQKNALDYVSAKNQCKYLHYLIDENILTKEEFEVVKRGRNSKINSHPKNVDVITYKWATALECLFGYLYIEEDSFRIKELIDIIIGANI